MLPNRGYFQPDTCFRCGQDREAGGAPSHSVAGHRYCESCALIVADRVDKPLARMIRQSRARRVQWAKHFSAPTTAQGATP